MSNIALGKEILEEWKNSSVLTNGSTTISGRQSYSSAAWPNYLTLDLESACKIQTIRFLLYDRDTRIYRYRLLTSEDLVNWVVHYDTQEKGYKSWQEFTFKESIKARYVRIHCMWNSKNDFFHIIELQVYDTVSETLDVPEINKRVLSANIVDMVIESGDGQVIAKQMKQLISNLETLVHSPDSLVKPEPFMKIVNSLKTQVNDVTALESSIDSIRREILNPVRKELEYGNKLGKYSVWGFIVGFIGIIVSIFATLNGLFKWV